MRELSVSAPGRVCLFGEHQDYLRLPVITAAINLRVTITGHARPDRLVQLDLPDVGSVERFALPDKDDRLEYIRERDYFRSVVNVAAQAGLNLRNGCEGTVRGSIPINAGTSSSSALNVAWTKFLIAASRITDPKVNAPEHIAHLAYLAEVEEFDEPGGMMDQYATAVGGVLFVDFTEPLKIEKLQIHLGTFVLGDSGQAKDTKGILSRVKQGVLNATEKIREEDPVFDLRTVSEARLEGYRRLVSPSEFEVLTGAILNREITSIALKNFCAEVFDHEEFGELLTEHHQVLDKLLHISTSKIDDMLDRALKAGAYGGKINGSGGGGCMFVYAPEDPQAVAKAVEKAGGKAYVISVDHGVRLD